MTKKIAEDLAALFHENSKIVPYQNNQDLSDLPPVLTAPSVLARYQLPPVTIAPSLGIEAAIAQRTSTRWFDPGRPLGQWQISRLLALSGGYTLPSNGMMHRAMPSAGALYPIEIYPIILRACDLPIGVYHYAATDHSIGLLRAGDFHQEFSEWALHQPYIADAGMIIVLAGVPARVCGKYSERGYRYLLFEAGHIAQNLCLLATAYQLGALVGGGFVDQAINQLLGLDGHSQIALYFIAIGHLPLS